MNHKQKKTLARKLLTRTERDENVAIFQSTNWEKRKEFIRKKVENVIAKQRAVANQLKEQHETINIKSS